MSSELPPYVRALMSVAAPEAAELLAKQNKYHIRAQIESPEKWYWQEGLRLLKETVSGEDKTLDVGCGFAGFSYGAQMAGVRNVYSTDVNHVQLACAEAALRVCGLEPNIIYDGLADIALRFRAVCAFDFLYRLKRDGFVEIISQMTNLLEPGGLLIFTMATPEATALANPRATRLPESDIIEICRALGLVLHRIERPERRVPFFAFRKKSGHEPIFDVPVDSASAKYLAALEQAAGEKQKHILVRSNFYHMHATIDSPAKWYWRDGLEILRETLDQNGKIIDVGCGVAGFSHGVRAMGLFPHTYSTDINRNQIRLAEKAFRICGMEPNIIHDDLDAIKMKFKGVCMFDVLYILPREQIFPMVSRLADLAEPGGMVIFTMATPESIKLKTPGAVRLPESEIVAGSEALGLSLYAIRRRKDRVPLFAFKKK